MSDILKRLFDEGSKAKENAYAPYSDHPVGAALVTPDGKIFAGCNVETANYKGTCAEAGAIASMAATGERRIAKIAVIGPGEHVCTPCGDCRQRIREFSDAATRIYVFDKQGNQLREFTMEELLPDSFGPDNVREMNP
ncbi:MAG: cytidine deaminase [Micavibrio sp.]